METIIWLIQNYGYDIVFLGTLLEGEVIVTLAGFAAYQGHLHVSILLPIAIAGAVTGDHIFFYWGRFKGRQFLATRPYLAARVEQAEKLSEQYHEWIIFGSRFMYGFRTILPITLGVSRVSAVKFFVFNFLGAIVWGFIFVGGGYLFGGAIERFLGNVKKFEGGIIIGILLVVSIVQFFTWLRGYRKRKKEGRAAPIGTQAKKEE